MKLTLYIIGISDSGSHGGSSKAEVEIPLTFIIESCKPDVEPKLQIDLAPTIAVLMGVPIPSNNLGSLIFGAIDMLQMNEKLYACFVNAHNIAVQSGKNMDDPDYQLAIKLYQDWLAYGSVTNGEQAANAFAKAVTKMSSRTIDSLANFDCYLMIVAIILSFQVRINLNYLFQKFLGTFFKKKR